MEADRMADEEREPDLSEAELELAVAILSGRGGRPRVRAIEWFDADASLAPRTVQRAKRLVS